jgi:hypothetical protein
MGSRVKKTRQKKELTLNHAWYQAALRISSASAR